MTIVSTLRRLKASFVASAGTIVFGMEDGTVSIFGLVFGVAATTTSNAAVLVAGASGAAAAAVSMMAGAYLDAETSRDERAARVAQLHAQLTSNRDAAVALLPERLAAAGLQPRLSAAVVRAVQPDTDATEGLLLALLGTAPDAEVGPTVQALWMLVADFLSAAVPIVPFMLLPVAQARIVSGAITIMLLVVLGIGRARIGNRPVSRTVAETVCIGIAAALAGVAIGIAFDRAFSG
jgi:VIT1/CCC1 family predicted Fe2+/Mn2+ transporter